MKRSALLTVALLTVTLPACTPPPRTATTVLEEARTAIGDPTSIQFVATGINGWMGQALLAEEDWPRRPLTSYTRTINYEQRSAAEEMVFAEAVFGGQRQNTQVNGDKAWNIGPNGPVPQLAAAEERQLQIWLTPHGFIRGALAAGDATLAESNGVATVSFKALGKYAVTGTIDAQHLVTRVATTTGNPVLGDAAWIADYSDYAEFSGIKYPKRIVITHAGPTLWDLTVTSVTPNAPVDLPIPESVASATAPPVRVASAKIGDGVWFLGGGSHHSVLVEFADHVAVVEAPQNDARSLAVIDEVKKLVPNKPIRYLITSHHHFDHTGGFRTYVAEGATIVTHQSNVAYFQKAAAAPATVAPDTLANRPKPATFQGVADKHVLTDGRQTIEIYATAGDSHTKEYTLVYLPKQRILVEGDAYSPPAADAPPPSPAPPPAVALFDDVQKLKLRVATIAPIHGRGPVPFGELRKYIGS
jgi:glyoxylase-like metal-dependent hydrolase (beta-lactamase superfamily II)